VEPRTKEGNRPVDETSDARRGLRRAELCGAERILQNDGRAAQSSRLERLLSLRQHGGGQGGAGEKARRRARHALGGDAGAGKEPVLQIRLRATQRRRLERVLSLPEPVTIDARRGRLTA
jgi:hypothetical protein